MALANAYYTNIVRASAAQVSNESSPEIDYTMNEENDDSEKAIKNLTMSQSSSISSPSSTNSSGYNNLIHGSAAPKANLQLEENHALINFKNGFNSFVHGGGSFLNFETNEQRNPIFSPKMSQQNEYSFWGDLSCDQSSSNSYGFINNANENPQGEEVPFRWKRSESNGTDKELQGKQLASFNKRPLTGENTQALKRHCSTSATKKQPKPKTTPSKDPQSVAAKNRRERISERLKVLQELVPNGTKVDLVTMLEKAISYVKFLQLQVKPDKYSLQVTKQLQKPDHKVLAADEFWPAQGGRAPDLSQVKEALDAILSTQRERSSSSK